MLREGRERERGENTSDRPSPHGPVIGQPFVIVAGREDRPRSNALCHREIVIICEGVRRRRVPSLVRGVVRVLWLFFFSFRGRGTLLGG